jgi:hypothetical protein
MEYFYSYIASGGIGNRSAAISSFLYDKFVLNCNNVSLVWNSHIMENSLPEQLWKNWDIDYHTKPIHNANSLNWYFHVRSIKSEFVKSWWKTLIPVDYILNELTNFKEKYDCGIVIRNLRFQKTQLNHSYLYKLIEDQNYKSVLIVGDDDIEINKFIEKCPIGCEKYKNSKHVKDDDEIRSHEHVLSSLIEWYAIQRCQILYKNTPVSTFSDYCEYMLNIPTLIS